MRLRTEIIASEAFYQHHRISFLFRKTNMWALAFVSQPLQSFGKIMLRKREKITFSFDVFCELALPTLQGATLNDD